MQKIQKEIPGIGYSLRKNIRDMFTISTCPAIKQREYLERGLPPYLQTSIKQMCASWAIEDSGKKDYHWDIAWNELNADINAAESGLEISSEQAWYLREKYLRMKRGE